MNARSLLLLFFCCASLQSELPYGHYKTNVFSLFTTPTWREYPLSARKIHFNKEKWAWTSSFVLKSKRPLKFTTLVLEWKGKKIDALAASLYQKKEREELLPIQKNLICQGAWNSTKQQLVFTLNEKVVAVNKYHLVVSYPKRLEGQVKQGKFVVKDTAMKLLSA